MSFSVIATVRYDSFLVAFDITTPPVTHLEAAPSGDRVWVAGDKRLSQGATPCVLTAIPRRTCRDGCVDTSHRRGRCHRCTERPGACREDHAETAAGADRTCCTYQKTSTSERRR